VPNLTRGDLRAFLPQYDLPDAQVDRVIDIVRAWLLDATDLDVLPDPMGEILWAAALELAALLASNPESLAQKTIGPTSRSWPLAPRRDAILDRLRKRYRRARMAPQGSYPPPQPWPVPAVSSPLPGPYATPGSEGWAWVGPP
jgi:hypothetical protein